MVPGLLRSDNTAATITKAIESTLSQRNISIDKVAGLDRLFWSYSKIQGLLKGFHNFLTSISSRHTINKKLGPVPDKRSLMSRNTHNNKNGKFDEILPTVWKITKYLGNVAKIAIFLLGEM